MFDALLSGFVLLFQWPAIGYLGLGIALGLYFGAVPGLSGLVGMAILLPFTFGMEPISAFAFLLGMYAVTTTSDTIASVLLGIPGTAASQATILDGYPMAMRGEAARALGAAFTVSAIGGVLGALVLAASIPLVRPLILSFASPEYFMLGVLGLTMVGALSGNSILKDIAAALFGLLLSTIGYADQVAIPRYFFGVTYLLDGLPLIPLVLGLFAVPALFDLSHRGTSISRVPRDDTSDGVLRGARDALVHKWLVLRSTVIGVYIGMLPGLGGAIVDWVAYGHAVQSARDKSGFGSGDVRGVIAPETANNAMKGGALVPTVAFGIPGSAPMAILLGAFLIQGMTPGPEMLTAKLDVTFSMVATLIVANVVGALLLMIWAKQIARATFISGHLIVPAVVLFVFMGAWMSGNNIGDWYLLLAIGAVGIAMQFSGWPRPPLVLGFILGPIMENALSISLRSYDGFGFLGRPVSLVLVVVTALVVGYTVWRQVQERRRPAVAGPDGEAVKIMGEGAFSDPRAAVVTDAVLFAVLVAAIWIATAWPRSVAMLPLVAAVPALALTAFALARDVSALRRGDPPDVAAGENDGWGGAVFFLLWIAGIVVATLIAGQLVALPLMMAAYLLLRGGHGWKVALGYAVGGWLFLYLMFDRVIAVIWYPSLLFD
jgi:putative tricarboxylic transport membrane protein